MLTESDRWWDNKKVVDQFSYLGMKVTSDGKSKEGIKCRMGMGRKAFSEEVEFVDIQY